MSMGTGRMQHHGGVEMDCEAQKLVLFDYRNGLATLRLNSPSNRNAISKHLVDDLVAAFTQLTTRSDIRVALIRAEGAMFCPGADLDWLRPQEAGAQHRVDDVLSRLNPFLVRLREIPILVVAAVQGAVAGGGIGIMNAADLVIASSESRFNLAYSGIGATPDLGATFYLPRLMNERRALELILLSEPFDAIRAKELGLINFVAPQEDFDDEVARLVQRLLDGPSKAYAAVKRMIYGASSADLATRLETERRELTSLVLENEFREGVAAYIEKRPPKFHQHNLG